MKFILINADLFDLLTEKIRTLTEEVEKVCKEMDYANQKWLDSQDVCHIMGISYRTLQYYREKGEISFTRIGRKTYYKPEDVEKLLSKSLIKK